MKCNGKCISPVFIGQFAPMWNGQAWEYDWFSLPQSRQMKFDICGHFANFTCIWNFTFLGILPISHAYENAQFLGLGPFHMLMKIEEFWIPLNSKWVLNHGVIWHQIAWGRRGSLAGWVGFEYTSGLFRGDSMCLTARVRPSEFARVFASGMTHCFVLWSWYVCWGTCTSMVYAVAVEARLVLLYSVAINLACVSGHGGHRHNLNTSTPKTLNIQSTPKLWNAGIGYLKRRNWTFETEQPPSICMHFV